MNFLKRFWNKVDQVNFDECWNWLGYKDRDGRGQFKFAGKKVQAHRFMWEIEVDAIPEGMHVLHTCDNPSCVNPYHLWLGTNDDNIADKVKKGRQSKGETIKQSKLTTEEVIVIRKMHKEGSSLGYLADVFGVSKPTICEIVNYKTWRDV